MNITELDSYNLADAVKFNDQLNPRLWDQSEHLLPEVRERLLEIADDFREFLGVTDLAIKDITISGSNAAYTYTPNSDIDLHLVVDIPDNPVYRELFDAKKFQYNEQHNIRIGGADVELYVQDADKPHISQGIYSLLNNDWAQVPRRVKSVVDDTSTRDKFEKVGRQIESAVKSGSLKRMTGLAEKIKKMRQTGLENHGEFGPENLAFKMLRSQGLIKQLYDARNRARDQELSLAEQEPRKPFVYGFKKVQEASSPDGVSPETKMFLSEEPPADDEGVLQDFVGFCADELKLEQVPTIRLRRDPQWSVRNRTFGRYTNDHHVLEVAWGNRHIMDVLRTVAHELTHTRQYERDGDRMGPDAGETGSPYENEANARAGVLMRDYGRQHPELFDADTANEELDESLQSRTAAAAVVAALLGQPTGAMAQSIQGILGFIRDAGTVVQQAQNITRAGLNAEVQQEINNYVRGVGGDAGSQNLSQLYQLQRQLQQQEPPQQDQQYRQPQNESASGYIPTKKQAKDPRYSMALSVDIKPGQIGKEANKLKLQTDRQGHPKIANPNGLVEALMLELKQFQDLDEVRMAPRDLKRFADSPEAKGIRAGFEAELVFTGMGEESYDELEPDYGADERAYSIQQVLDFFQNDDWGYAISDRTAKRVEEQLDEMYLEWRDEQMMDDWRRGDNEELISDALLDEQPMTERIHSALTDDMELTDDEADAVIILQARRERGEIEGSDMTDEQLEQATQYSKAKSIAYDMLAKEVEQSIEKQDGIYDAALQAYSENYSGDDDSFFSDVGLRYMSDVAEQFTLEWPYMTGGGGGEGGWSESNADHLADSLAKALGVKVKVSGGYHNATRDDTSWIIEPDSSLESDESDNMTAEIVSPPMPLDECLTKMEEFFAWAESEGAYANSSTGFHMGVSLPTKFHEDVDFTKLALFLGDEYVLREFGREANTYCRSAMEKIRSRLGSDSGSAVSGALDLMKNNLIELAHRSIANNMGFGKYTSINPKGNYIEFRSAGNTNYFEDVDKLKNTLLRYARAMKIAGDPSAERNEYAKKLYKLLAPAQQDPAMSLFSKFSAGELTGKELKSQWAELSLMKERPKPGEDREWEAVDTYTDEVLGTVQDFSATNATNYFRDTLGNAYKFRVREKEPEPTSARAKLAKRIKTPKEKDDQQDSENLQARISADVANVQRRWEFYRAETGAVIDTVDDINMMQANAVRDDIVRRYGHPDESVRMRSVPTAASAERVRARATLGEPRPAFGDVDDVEPDVAQNFSAGTQRNIGGSLAWELYNRETGETVRTFWQPNEAEASRYAQEYVRDVLGSGSYSIRPQMTTNESRDLRESAMMGKIESTGKIVRIIRKQHSVKFSDQKDWLLIDTDPEKGDKGAGLKWVPASTRFEWVRPYRETIDEAFDQPYPLHWASPRDDTVLAMTKLNDGSPLVIRFDSEGDHWQVVFDRNSSFEVTGEGDAQRIFATVLSAIGQFVKEHQPQSLTFSASKDVDTKSANPESRAKLYNRLVQRYASSVGYKVHSREQGDEVVYLLRPNTVTTEATYPGNIGMMEVSKFFNIATPEEKIKFKQLKDAGETSKAWRLIQQVIGVKLQGNEFAEQLVEKDVDENFADGKVKGKSRPGRVKRAGASCDGSVTSLRKRAKNASGEKAKMYHWCANMKSGRKK